MSIEIRLARSGEEVEAVQRQRYDIFVNDMGYSAPATHHELQRIIDPLDAGGEILVAYDGDRLAGSVLLSSGAMGAYGELDGLRRFGPYFPTRLMLISKLVIDPAYRRGTLMIRLATAQHSHCVSHHPRTLFCVMACRDEHMALFGRLGYRALGDSFAHPSGQRGYLMALAIYDLEHLLRSCPAVAKLCPHHDAESSDWFERTFASSQPEVVA